MWTMQVGPDIFSWNFKILAWLRAGRKKLHLNPGNAISLRCFLQSSSLPFLQLVCPSEVRWVTTRMARFLNHLWEALWGVSNLDGFSTNLQSHLSSLKLVVLLGILRTALGLFDFCNAFICCCFILALLLLCFISSASCLAILCFVSI